MAECLRCGDTLVTCCLHCLGCHHPLGTQMGPLHCEAFPDVPPTPHLVLEACLPARPAALPSLVYLSLSFIKCHEGCDLIVLYLYSLTHSLGSSRHSVNVCKINSEILKSVLLIFIAPKPSCNTRRSTWEGQIDWEAVWGAMEVEHDKPWAKSQ